MAAQASRTCLRIATHSGTFHADEALACYMLRLLPEYKNAEVVRTRDPAVLATADIVVDVGGEYDPARHRYDHHQRSFTEVFSPRFNRTRLSSAGLVYKHFGKRIIQLLYQQEQQQKKKNDEASALTDADVEVVHDVVYENLIEAFDGIDNGVDRIPRGTPEAYKDKTSLSHVVGSLNDYSTNDSKVADQQFFKASKLVGEHFERVVVFYATDWYPAKRQVRIALENRFTVHPCGHILMFEQMVPWKAHVHDLEAELGLAKNTLLYVVYPDVPANTWRMQAVNQSESSFESRLPLPGAWLGLRDAELDRAIADTKPAHATEEVPQGAVFVHATGFTGAHRTRDGAIAMCVRSIHISQQH